MINTGINSIRNMYVLKEKLSEFSDLLDTDPILNHPKTLRILSSGNYYIFTFDVTAEQKKRIKEIQDDWI